MSSTQYSPGIRIKHSKMKDDAVTKSAITNALKRQDFIDKTTESLNALKTTPTGARLLQAIDASGHRVDIYRTWDADDGNFQGGDDTDLAMVVDLDTQHPGGTTELRKVLNHITADLSDRWEITKFFGFGMAKYRYLGIDAIARLVGTSTRDLERMADHQIAIPDAVDARLRSFLYDFLTPGPGCSCFVVFNHTRDNLSDDHRRFLPQTRVWEHRPPLVALGHELIHAWRVMVGRVLFFYGWEEEAMTVGLPPFSSMDFTENRLRIEYGGLAVRPDYQNLDPSTKLTEGMKRGVGNDQAWQGKQGVLATPLEQSKTNAADKRRKAMGYGDADDDGDDW